jgi:hypothetical protein
MKLEMKRIIIAICIVCACISASHAQVRIVNSATNTGLSNSPAFIDASSNVTVNSSNNIGKGLVFPRVDLTQMNAFPGVQSGLANQFPTRFDGMIVYNTAESGVAGVGSTEGTLSPGFWYYENKSTTNSAGGTWKPLGSSSSASDVLDAAGNGLTKEDNSVLLGGTLTKPTEIAQAGFNLYTTGTGKVSIGAAPTANSAKFEVSGAAANTAAYSAGAATTIDFSQSNLAYTSASAGAFTLNNLKDGGAYTLAVQGTTSGTASFSATNTAAAALTVRIVNNMATVSGTHTLYTILVMGTTAYVFVSTGF